MRLQVRHMLLMVVLASPMCMAVRSLLVMDPIGILVWPVLLGFGTDRLLGGRGVRGGTIGGLLAFATAAGLAIAGSQPTLAGWTDPWLSLVPVVALASGICWGFYLASGST